MATESAFSKLAAKPLGYQIGVLFGVMAMLGLVYYQLMYSSLDEELISAQSRERQLSKKNRELQARLQEWESMVNAQPGLMKELAANEVSLPATAALPSFVGHLQDEAAIAGVTFRTWKRAKEVPVGAYVKVPVSVEVVGSFHQVMRYFYLLGKTKRIITVENFSLEPVDKNEGDGTLKAKFQATTFRQPDGAAGAASFEFSDSALLDTAEDARAKKEAAVEEVTGRIDEQGNPVEDGAPSSIDRLKNPGGGQ